MIEYGSKHFISLAAKAAAVVMVWTNFGKRDQE